MGNDADSEKAKREFETSRDEPIPYERLILPAHRSIITRKFNRSESAKMMNIFRRPESVSEAAYTAVGIFWLRGNTSTDNPPPLTNAVDGYNSITACRTRIPPNQNLVRVTRRPISATIWCTHASYGEQANSRRLPPSRVHRIWLHARKYIISNIFVRISC